MKLSRHILKYLIIYYLPSGLFVVVSWVGFLIPPEVIPGRMALLITLFLVLTNIFNIITTNSPNVEGMTAIAAWMLVCIFFVFGALVGYAYLLWKKKKKTLPKRNRLTNKKEKKMSRKVSSDEQSLIAKVDSTFLVIFPIMFLVFNMIYWPLFLRSSVPDNDKFTPEDTKLTESMKYSPLVSDNHKKPTDVPVQGLPLGLYTLHNRDRERMQGNI